MSKFTGHIRIQKQATGDLFFVSVLAQGHAGADFGKVVSEADVRDFLHNNKLGVPNLTSREAQLIEVYDFDRARLNEIRMTAL